MVVQHDKGPPCTMHTPMMSTTQLLTQQYSKVRFGLLRCLVHLGFCRRDVWHGDDMAGAGQRRARWNEALLESAIAPAYAALIQEAANLLGPCRDFWRLLPLGQGSVPEPWLRVAAALHARLADRPVLYSPVNGGRWLQPHQMQLPDAACYVGTAPSRSIRASPGDSERPGTTGAQHSTDSSEQQGADVVDVGAAEGHLLGYVPPPLYPSPLASLLVECGVPLVMGLSEEQQRCLLKWGSKIAQVRWRASLLLACRQQGPSICCCPLS